MWTKLIPGRRTKRERDNLAQSLTTTVPTPTSSSFSETSSLLKLFRTKKQRPVISAPIPIPVDQYERAVSALEAAREERAAYDKVGETSVTSRSPFPRFDTDALYRIAAREHSQPRLPVDDKKKPREGNGRVQSLGTKAVQRMEERSVEHGHPTHQERRFYYSVVQREYLKALVLYYKPTLTRFPPITIQTSDDVFTSAGKADFADKKQPERDEKWNLIAADMEERWPGLKGSPWQPERVERAYTRASRGEYCHDGVRFSET
ncbi:MAG: hypothetical protein M1814_004773 [Vezdaea aestivalis]|nr:MAG: hypothetical protein M1814_004773 [Vezdaea aestivalis]